MSIPYIFETSFETIWNGFTLLQRTEESINKIHNHWKFKPVDHQVGLFFLLSLLSTFTLYFEFAKCLSSALLVNPCNVSTKQIDGKH